MAISIVNREALRLRPAAVLIDTDNTLYSYEPAHARAMQATREKAYRLLGVQPHEFDVAFRASRAEVKGQLAGTASSHSRLLYFQRTLEHLGLKTQILQTLDLEQTYWRTFLSEAVLFDEVKELLEDIRRLGIPIVNLTDLTAQIQFRKLVYFGIDTLIDFVVTSEEAGHDKPDTRPFHLALRKLGLSSQVVWMIGDNPICDIEGARRACNAVTFQKRHEEVMVRSGADAPDVVFDHYGELRRLVEGQLSSRTPSSGALLAS